MTVELGGKDAMLVLADANVPRWSPARCGRAAPAPGRHAARSSGLVAREVYEPFLAGSYAPRRLRVGDPADERTQLGPLSSPRRLARVAELVEEAVARGARLHCGGPVEGPAKRGGGASTRRPC